MSTTTNTGTYDEIVNALKQVATASGYMSAADPLDGRSRIVIDPDSLPTDNYPPVTANTPVFVLTVELYESVKLGRRAVGIELKPSYWRTAVDNMTALERDMSAPSLIDLIEGVGDE